MERSIRNILDSNSLRWIFVGGKGGVGKTTCSCSIAVQLAKCRERVLILSTDPAHNLSDAFNQKFSKHPTLIKGFDNLFAMEIDANLNLAELEEDLVVSQDASASVNIQKSMSQLMSSFPGIDEYMSYIEVLKLVRNLNYSVVVFDTAPTGHTLRLLNFPDMVDKGLSKVISMKHQFAPLLTQLMAFVGVDNQQSNDFTEALESRLPIVKEITQQFKDSAHTTFICVCIPEFLSMYETERLVQELYSQNIDVHNIIVNQLLFPNIITSSESEPTEQSTTCRMCLSRHKIQLKYLQQILELYDNMHVIQLPQLEEEIRGVESVLSFSENLLTPFRR